MFNLVFKLVFKQSGFQWFQWTTQFTGINGVGLREISCLPLCGLVTSSLYKMCRLGQICTTFKLLRDKRAQQWGQQL